MIKIAYVSTYEPQVCGIGTYCKNLIDSLHNKIDAKVFNEGTYWKRGTPMGQLAHQILEWGPDIIHVQHAYGFFFQIPEFVSFLKLVRDKNIVITFHEIPTYDHQLWYDDVLLQADPEADHRNDGRHADHDAEHRERGSQLRLPEVAPGERDDVDDVHK